MASACPWLDICIVMIKSLPLQLTTLFLKVSRIPKQSSTFQSDL